MKSGDHATRKPTPAGQGAAMQGGDRSARKAAPRQSLGQWGEQEAARYLAGHGYEILEHNHRTPHGELDLIARLPAANTIVFVEVKTRSTRTFGYPEESVNPRKQAHLLNAAQYYIQQHPDLTCTWRIDVIAIQRARPGQPAQITHFENALGM